MANSQLNGVLHHLRRAALRQEDLTDGQLLERFLADRDEGAFEALLRRHGPMVLGVCRRLLPSSHDAEDAFQATFLVLVHKASSITARESVGNWLYGVAHRTALKAGAAAARRRAKEKQMARPEAQPEQDLWRELRPLLDQELSRLPDKYREPIVLCDLEGQTRKEVARRLGCPEGTVSGRLARARAMLAKRLSRHGLALAGAVLALPENAASAWVPAPLLGSTVRGAALVAAGHAATVAVSAPVAALTEGVLKTMCLSKVKLLLAVLLAVGLLGAGWGAYQTSAAPVPAKVESNPVGPAIGAPGVGPALGAPIKGAENINLPTGPAPVQVLASLGKDGKLVIKTATLTFRPGNPANGAPPRGAPLPPGGGAAPAIARARGGWGLRAQTYDLADVQVFDTRGKKLAKKTVMKRLEKETVAVASMWGQAVDPLHLRVLKDGILVFVLPAPKGFPGRPGGIAPRPLDNVPGAPPGVRPGAPGAAPGDIGIALPGNSAPAGGPGAAP